MATLYHLHLQLHPQILSLSSPHYQHPNSSSFSLYPSCFLSNHHGNYKRQTVVCFASTKKSRPSRKLMSDEDLCNVLREFVASVGLPEGHVPSTKDLSKHGRKDLANIVRRRGHKLIKELLSNASEAVTDRLDSQENLNDEQKEIYVHEETGQEAKVNHLIEESANITLMNGNPATADSFVTLYDSAVSPDDQSHMSVESSASLQEKVENFMKYGHLDTVEDELPGGVILNSETEGKSSSSGENLVEREAVIHDEADIRHLASVSNSTGLNGTLVVQRLLAPPAMEDNDARDIYLSPRGPSDSSFDTDVNIEGTDMENEAEISHLKQMLHQKELELSRLKEEIEKEKQDLLILQTKAESEISKAQKLISEKDAELHAAEESLSGLLEAKIQYSGEAQMVEVAGSFNGWHQRIKMEPQPSSTFLDHIGTRKSRLWSTTLWLYPGVYEIKFVVDGQWQIDPQRESTHKGGVENNLLRVEG